MSVLVPPLEIGWSTNLDAATQEQAKKAAEQFEGVLLQQLLQVLRESTPALSGDQGRMYMSMADAAWSQALAESGGIGLAPLLEKALAGSTQATIPGTVARGRPIGIAMPVSHALQRYDVAGGPTRLRGAPAQGMTGVLQQIASQMLLQGASRWGRQGALGPSDLQSGFSSGAAGPARAHFNVRDASGYAGHYKCNLFAFEVARRSGLQVPLVAREAGWGYPSSDAVVEEAATGRIPWGWRVTGMAASALQEGIREGDRALLLAGSGSGDRPGHMAVVERIRRIDYDKEGRVMAVEFDGWEARTSGAQYLSRRVWKTRTCDAPSACSAHGTTRAGFEQVEIIELMRAGEGQHPERPLVERAPPSVLDGLTSSLPALQPNHRSEDDS